ncbi:MAG: hypothetical protein AAFQ96_02670 [Pseudomonadota bacterium]
MGGDKPAAAGAHDGRDGRRAGQAAGGAAAAAVAKGRDRTSAQKARVARKPVRRKTPPKIDAAE